MNLLDKITDNLYNAKTILEWTMKARCSIDEEVINRMIKVEGYIKISNAMIDKTEYGYTKIMKNLDFIRQDKNFIILFDFYKDVMDLLNEVNNAHKILCSKLLDL